MTKLNIYNINLFPVGKTFTCTRQVTEVAADAPRWITHKVYKMQLVSIGNCIEEVTSLIDDSMQHDIHIINHRLECLKQDLKNALDQIDPARGQYCTLMMFSEVDWVYNAST